MNAWLLWRVTASCFWLRMELEAGRLPSEETGNDVSLFSLYHQLLVMLCKVGGELYSTSLLSEVLRRGCPSCWEKCRFLLSILLSSKLSRTSQRRLAICHSKQLHDSNWQGPDRKESPLYLYHQWTFDQDQTLTHRFLWRSWVDIWAIWVIVSL